jgi:DNA-binding MarR family transcriptional regulator
MTLDKHIIHQLITFAIKHRKIMQNYLDATGVYHAQHRLLMEISRNPNAPQIELERQMDVSSATIAVSLKKLEKGGYIIKKTDDVDNRLNQIVITEKGYFAWLKRARRYSKWRMKSVLKGFLRKRRKTFYNCLKN